MRKDFPSVGGHFFGVDGNNNALAAEFFCTGANQLGVCQGRGVKADFVGPRPQHGVNVVHRPKTPTDSQRHEALIGGPFDHAYHRLPAMGAGGDIEEHHLISTLVIIAQRQFDGIADVSQLTRFGPAELDAARDLAIMHIQAWDNTFGNH